jgi:hypothetical protein
MKTAVRRLFLGCLILLLVLALPGQSWGIIGCVKHLYPCGGYTTLCGTCPYETYWLIDCDGDYYILVVGCCQCA